MSTAIFNTEHAFGYLSTEDKDESFHGYIYLHNACNGLSIVFSPIIGIIRLIASLILMNKLSQVDQDDVSWSVAALHNFLRMQAVRSVFEILCLGIILGTVVDGFMTCKHNRWLCFA